MFGLSPRPHSLTSLQFQVSEKINEAVPALPTTVSDLISEMAVPDFLSAQQKPELDQDGQLIQSPTNQRIVASIELALTSPSTECDPVIKEAIFDNANNRSRFSPTLLPYLVKIINGLTKSGHKINLDRVVLENSYLVLNGLDLTGLIARRCIFRDITFRKVNFASANLIGAKFIRCDLREVNLRQANITDGMISMGSAWDTDITGITGNQSAIFHAGSVLAGSFYSADPDRSIFTLPIKPNNS